MGDWNLTFRHSQGLQPHTGAETEPTWMPPLAGLWDAAYT